MRYLIKYFAVFRFKTNKDEEWVDSSAQNPMELFRELEQRYSFQGDLSTLRVAVNAQYSSFDAVLKDGDTVVFIPPISGG
ncbi:MAG: MoaD/ThiS family protein [Oligoflexia bacterium]|nr:MoaD/ThiS family protein [Oligoflexia bacterium]